MILLDKSYLKTGYLTIFRKKCVLFHQDYKNYKKSKVVTKRKYRHNISQTTMLYRLAINNAISLQLRANSWWKLASLFYFTSISYLSKISYNTRLFIKDNAVEIRIIDFFELICAISIKNWP